MKKFFVAVSAVLLAFSSNAFAAENTPYIEGHVGAVMPRDADVDVTVAAVPFTGSIGFKEREAFGGEFGVANIGGSGFRIGGSVLSTKMHLDEVCVDGVACAAASDKLDHLIYMGRVYYDFSSDSPLTPYVGLGAGFSDIQDTGTDVAWSVAGGVNYSFTNNIYVGLRGEYIYAYTKDTSVDGATVISVDGQDFWSGAVVLGFKF